MKRKKKSMFFPAKHKELAKIVKIDSPANAKKASKQLLSKFKHARTREQKVTIKKATVLAANRAEASAKRKNISKKEKRELREVAKIYRKTAKKMKLSVIVLLLLFVMPANATSSSSNIGGGSSISPSSTLMLKFYDKYGTALNFYDFTTYVVNNTPLITRVNGYYSAWVDNYNLTISGNGVNIYYKFDKTLKKQQYIIIHYADGTTKKITYYYYHVQRNVILALDPSRGATLKNLALTNAPPLITVGGSVVYINSSYWYFDGSTVYKTTQPYQLHDFYIHFEGVIFGRLADKNKILFQPLRVNFQPLRLDSDGVGLGYRVEINNVTKWNAYWLNNVDAYNNTFVRVYASYTYGSYLDIGINNFGKGFTNPVLLRTGAEYIYIGGTPYITYTFQGYLHRLFLFNTSMTSTLFHILYNNTPVVHTYYANELNLAGLPLENNTIVFVLLNTTTPLKGAISVFGKNITRIDFKGLHALIEIYNATHPAKRVLTFDNMLKNTNLIYPDDLYQYTNYSQIIHFDYTDFYFVTSVFYTFPFDVAMKINDTVDITYADLYNFTATKIRIYDRSRLNYLYMFYFNASYQLSSVLLDTAFVAKNATIKVYANDTLVYFGWVTQYIVLDLVVLPSATLIINYYDINTGLGVSFNTFKTYINNTRVFYNILEYPLRGHVIITTYDYFDVLISNVSIDLDDENNFVDIGVNLTTVYLSNQRDENVTFVLSSNNRNYTITLPPYYVKAINLVTRRYVVYIMSKTIGVLSFNLTAAINDNIIVVQKDKVIKTDAQPAVYTITSVAQQTITQWASSGLIFGIFSTIGAFIASIVFTYLLRKRRQRIVVYKASIW